MDKENKPAKKQPEQSKKIVIKPVTAATPSKERRTVAPSSLIPKVTPITVIHITNIIYCIYITTTEP